MHVTYMKEFYQNISSYIHIPSVSECSVLISGLVGFEVSRKFLTSSLRHIGPAGCWELAVGASGISFRAMEARPRFYYDIQSFPGSLAMSTSCIIFITWRIYF